MWMNEVITTKWNQRWRSVVTDGTNPVGGVTYEFFKTIEERRKCSNLPDYITSQFLTGHGNEFQYYRGRFEINGETDKMCRYCGGMEQTSIHLVRDCNRFAVERHNFYSSIPGEDQLVLNRYFTDKNFGEFNKFVKTIHKNL